MSDDALVTDMIATFFADGGTSQSGLYREDMRRALSVARKAILEEAAQRFECFDRYDWSPKAIAAGLRYLAKQEHTP
jgi:hypothetical protein